jgi:hypothetical protein
LLVSVIIFAFWYGRQSERRSRYKPQPENTFEKAELDAGKPLNVEEKAELESRRRAAELEGREIGIIRIGMADSTEEMSERAELEARRKAAREAVEIG